MAGTRPKDMQRQKFEAALAQAKPIAQRQEFQTMSQAATFFNKTVRSSWWQKRYNTVRPGGGRLELRSGAYTCAHYDRMGTAGGSTYVGLAVPMTRFDILHALAHILAPSDAALHGAEFVRTFITLVERFMGKQSKDNLITILAAHKVKRSTWSPEAKERARQRALENGTPFGAQRQEEARAGVIELLRSLHASEPDSEPEPESNDPIDRMLKAAAEEGEK